MTDLSQLNVFFNTDDADATAADILTGKTAYVKGGKVTGSLAQISVDGLRVFHLFDGTASTEVNGMAPIYCEDQSAVFSVNQGNGVVTLDGNGFAQSSIGSTCTVFLDPTLTSRSGKTRRYKIWGKILNGATNDYVPNVQTNYVDASNFWSCRSYRSSNLISNQMYEWIGGAVGEGVRTSAVQWSSSGEYEYAMDIMDFGDTVACFLTLVDESDKTTDLNISLPQLVQLYKASRPNQDVEKFGLKWEVATPANYLVRGIMVWDE